MKFFNIAVLLGSLSVAASAVVNERSLYARGSALVSRDADTIDTKSLHRRVAPANPPAIPADAATKTHVWVRTDTEPQVFSRPNMVNAVDHAGLDQLIVDIGGKHVDIVYNDGKTLRTSGLEFKEDDWVKNYPNGDGAATSVYKENYSKGQFPAETFQYKGYTTGGARAVRNAVSAAGANAYNHQTNNCQTWSQAVIDGLTLSTT